MLVVSLLFLYMLFVTVVSGDAILNGMRSSTVRGEGRMPLTACAFAGLTAACVYAQLWSLFAAVSTAAVTLWPLCLLFRDRNRASRRVFWLTAAAVLAVVLPFLIRNVILSVYLIYPYPGLDLFDVPWKIPAEVAVQDAMEIGIYGRTVADAVTVFPLGLWICSWWESLQLSDRLVLIADLVALAGWILLAVRGMAAGRRKKPLPEELSYLPLMAALYASLLLWFLAAPLMRYGFAFVRLPAWISAGMRFAAAAATTAGKESPPCGNALCCSHGAADLLQRRASGMGRVPGVPPVLPRDAGGL